VPPHFEKGSATRDYKHFDTILYFIITNLHTELKPQINASHDMHSLAFTILYAHRLVTEAPLENFSPPWKNVLNIF